MCETERLAFSVLRRDKDLLRRLAVIEGEAMAVVMRRLIRQAARERGLLPTADQHCRRAATPPPQGSESAKGIVHHER